MYPRIASVAIALACAALALALAYASFAGPVCAAEPAPQDHAAAKRTLRAMDCARCHGRDYDGWAAPSVLEFVRSQPRERFDRVMLDGEPARGMPGYRDQRLVAEQLDALYAYFLAQAAGRGD